MDALDELKKQLAEMKEQIIQRFDAMDQRLDTVDQRFDAMDQRLDTVDQRFDAMDQRLDTIADVVNRIHAATVESLDGDVPKAPPSAPGPGAPVESIAASPAE